MILLQIVTDRGAERVLNRGNSLAKNTSKSLNKALNKGRTELSKQIRKEYNIKAKDLKKRLTLRKAKTDNLSGSIYIKGDKIPLYYFSTQRSLNHKTKVRFKVRKNNNIRTLKGAFYAVMRTGHIGIFATMTSVNSHNLGDYRFSADRTTRKKIRVGTSELPITELYTTDATKMFENAVGYDEINRILRTTYIAEFRRLQGVRP